MIALSTNWSEAWQMAGMSIGMVFVILLLIVAVLNIFTAIIKKTSAKAKDVKATYTTNKQDKAFAEASNEDKAAVAVALYLYFNDDHDHESGVVTINQNPKAWGRLLNPRN